MTCLSSVPARHEPYDADVIIVGAGPVGLVAAMDLDARGISVILVEQRPFLQPPSVKCNHVAARTMERFRRLGVVAQVLLRLDQSVDAEPLTADTGQRAPAPGLYVTAVASGSPASSAGIRRGDIVMTIDGARATSPDQLVELSLRSRPGTKVTLGIDRSGQQKKATVVLGAEP